jgi:UDP-glucose 4-epimerase
VSWAGRKVVVTGGAGFIGSHVARELVRRGARVTVVDNLSTGRLPNLADVAGEVETIQASTLEPLRLARAFRGAETVFHLAAVLGVKRTWEEPVRVIHENVVGTENVLRAAADAGARRVVLASSSEVYGDGAPPYAEERTPAAPRTGYAAAKLVEEKLAEGFHSETGLRTACLRYFNVYGAGQESSAYGFVTAIFCDRVRKGLPPVVFGDGTQTRDFTYVEDTVEGTLLAAEKAADHDVLNLGTGRETSVLDLARAVLAASGRRDLRPEFAPKRADEVTRRVADASRATRVLGWAPRVGLEDGLRRTLAAFTPVARPAAPRPA